MQPEGPRDGGSKDQMACMLYMQLVLLQGSLIVLRGWKSWEVKRSDLLWLRICSVSLIAFLLAMMRHYDQSSWGRKGFFLLTLP